MAGTNYPTALSPRERMPLKSAAAEDCACSQRCAVGVQCLTFGLRNRQTAQMLLEKAPIQHQKRPKTYQAAVFIMVRPHNLLLQGLGLIMVVQVLYCTILLASSLAIVYSSDAAPR
jgi:hypothetical protein